MKAIRVYIDEENTDKVGSVVERLNSYEDTVATMVGAQELFIAATNVGAIKYAVAVIETELIEVSIQYVK